MGAIERNGYQFEPEFSVTYQNGAVHVYKQGEFIEELKFTFSGKYPEASQIDEIVEQYCEQHNI